MGADREGGARRRPVRAAAYAVCGVVLLAGCASMPDNGDLRDVESTPRQDTQVRVFAMPPQQDASATEIVQGFLEALTSDDPHFDTARKYLTTAAAKTWRPESRATVLANGPSIQTTGRPTDQDDTDSITYLLQGSRVATVDAEQAYAPSDGAYRKTVHLTKDGKSRQWRIDSLPQGVVMGKSDFQRNYTSVDKYYFASDTSTGETGQPVAVADPVFLRSRVDPTTQLVRSLLNGPTTWLEPVVRSSFPTGTALKKGVSGLTPDDQNQLTVPLNVKASRIGAAKCTEMATQLLFTLRNLTPTVDSVALRSVSGAHMCDVDEEQAGNTAWRASDQRPEYLYLLDSKHRLVRMATGGTGTSAVAVPGPFGAGTRPLRSVAVSRDERTAAGVTSDGRSLYVSSLTSDGSLGDAVLTSHGASAADRLTAPSWDARGDLWVADRDPGKPQLYMLAQGVAQPLAVQVPELNGRIQDVRVAADGARIALVVEKDGKQSLLVGRIERTKSDDQQEVSVLELRSATPGAEEVTAMSWAGDSRLVVVGREQGGVQQTRYVQVDGSTPDGPAPAALTGVLAIAASEDDRVPLVADSQDDGIVRLPSGDQWQKVVKDGSVPVYPG
ncbi:MULTISPECIES: LpqB family beta-propeller domain-containing protein [Streptomyces]|uniref:LpqB family beta-propeller domain-containing protein n=1 Tax=Streptomyces arenae TaxID=29301 RepID=UPI0010549A11|nr:LpqB family beta-propeller domain-containing protein [Streptomyces arenae]MCG7207095.1 LpqB family beta-propeller domain-containing protein [Streptomyces arenae]